MEIASTKTPIPVQGTVKVIGPWQTRPEADAANCETAQAVLTEQLTFDYAQISPRARVAFTPDKPGIYRVLVDTQENEQNTPVNTCTDKDAKRVTIAVGG